MPSPCSPEWDPCRRTASRNTSSAIERKASMSEGSFMFRDGRTCRSPTEACAYQVLPVPWRAKMSSTAAPKSASAGSGIAQSSTIETGFRSPFMDITMLRPARRTAQIAACSAGSSARVTSRFGPVARTTSCRRPSLRASGPASSPANSTRSTLWARGGISSSTVERNVAFCRARRVSVSSTSSTACGSSSTMCWTASSASSSDGKPQTPSTRRAGRRDSLSVSLRKNASVPSEPTSSSAIDPPGRCKRCRL